MKLPIRIAVKIISFFMIIWIICVTILIVFIRNAIIVPEIKKTLDNRLQLAYKYFVYSVTIHVHNFELVVAPSEFFSRSWYVVEVR